MNRIMGRIPQKAIKLALVGLFAVTLSGLTFAASFAPVPRSELVGIDTAR